MRHDLLEHKNCTEWNCPICDGGLALCVICGGAEGSLTTECCGRKLTKDEQKLIMNGALDFQDNRWIEKAV